MRPDFSRDVFLHRWSGHLENEVGAVGVAKVPDARGGGLPAEILNNRDGTDGAEQPCGLLSAQIWMLGIWVYVHPLSLLS